MSVCHRVHMPCSAEEYASNHGLHNLVDFLIVKVAENRPSNPARYMADLVRQRISERGDKATADGTAVKKSAAVTRLCFTEAATEAKRRRLSHIGIWSHIRYCDLPELAAQFRERLCVQCPEAPQQLFTETELLIQRIAIASVSDRVEGLLDSISLLPITRGKYAPTACSLLVQTLFNFVPQATATERRSLVVFMERVTNYFSEVSQLDFGLMASTWRSLSSDSEKWNRFVHLVRRELLFFDHLLVVNDTLMENCFECLGRVAFVLPTQCSFLEEVIEPVYSSMAEPNLLPSPDHLHLHCAACLWAMPKVLGMDVFSLEASLAWEEAVLRLLHAFNDFTAEVFRFTLTSPRRTDPSLMRGLRMFLGNKHFPRQAPTGEGDVPFASALERFPRYSEEMADNFIFAAEMVLEQPQLLYEREGYDARFTDYMHRALLRLLSVIVGLRRTLSVDEASQFVVRCHCYGVAPANISVYLSELLSRVVDEGNVRDDGNAMLGVLQGFCVTCYQTSNLPETEKSLRLFSKMIDSVPLCEFMVQAMTHHQTSLPPAILEEYVGVKESLNRLTQGFTGSCSEDANELFKVVCLLGVRLRCCGVQVSPSCNFFSMALFAATHSAAQRVPLYALLPTMEVLAGLGPALCGTMEAISFACDREVILAYLQTIPTSRLLMLAMEDFLQLFPSYHRRLDRSSVSYEEVQRSFVTLLFSLLRCTVADLSPLLRTPAVQLAVFGVLPHDLMLFGLSLTRVLRSSSFPETAWSVFYMSIVGLLSSLSPQVKPLDTYTFEDVQRVTTLQRYARRLRAKRSAAVSQQHPAARLREVLNEPSDVDDDNLFSDDNDEIELIAKDRRVVYLSWATFSVDEQVKMVYNSVRGAMQFAPGTDPETWSPPFSAFSSAGASTTSRQDSRNTMTSSANFSEGAPKSRHHLSCADSNLLHTLSGDRWALLERCRTISSNLSSIIGALLPNNCYVASSCRTVSPGTAPSRRGLRSPAPSLDDDWIVVLKELYQDDYHTFFEGTLTLDQLLPFGTMLVEGVVRKIPCDQLSGIRAAWVSFMGRLCSIMEKSSGNGETVV